MVSSRLDHVEVVPCHPEICHEGCMVWLLKNYSVILTMSIMISLTIHNRMARSRGSRWLGALTEAWCWWTRIICIRKRHCEIHWLWWIHIFLNIIMVCLHGGRYISRPVVGYISMFSTDMLCSTSFQLACFQANWTLPPDRWLWVLALRTSSWTWHWELGWIVHQNLSLRQGIGKAGPWFVLKFLHRIKNLTSTRQLHGTTKL
jgi:hypothetical protein